MHFKKIILIEILLICIMPVSAWDDEGGYAEGEYVTISWSDWAYSWMESKNVESPVWYDPARRLILEIGMFFLSDHTDNEITINCSTEIETWDYIAGEYVPKDDDSNDFKWTSEQEIPINPNVSTEQTYTKDPIVEMVKQISDTPDLIDDIITTDDSPDHPDIFNTSIKISGGGVDIDDYGYTTINDAGLNSIDDIINSPDYGFVSSGRGSDAGSGGIYTGLNLYSGESDGTAEGAGSLFKSFFFVCIPILFIICVFKFISGILSQ